MDIATTRHPHGGSVYIVEERTTEQERAWRSLAKQNRSETLKLDRARPAPVEFTHSKTGSDDGCDPRLTLQACTAAQLEHFPLGRPTGITRRQDGRALGNEQRSGTGRHQHCAARQNANPCHSSSTRGPLLLRLGSCLTLFTPIYYSHYSHHRRYVERLSETLRQLEHRQQALGPTSCQGTDTLYTIATAALPRSCRRAPG